MSTSYHFIESYQDLQIQTNRTLVGTGRQKEMRQPPRLRVGRREWWLKKSCSSERVGLIHNPRCDCLPHDIVFSLATSNGQGRAGAGPLIRLLPALGIIKYALHEISPADDQGNAMPGTGGPTCSTRWIVAAVLLGHELISAN